MTPDGGFSKSEHILKSKDFRSIYKKGLRARCGAAVLYCLPNGLGHNRLGISIGSRFVKLATKRNRIRRVFREIYRKKKGILKKGYDLVLVVRNDFGPHISYEKLEEVFLKLAQSAGLLS